MAWTTDGERMSGGRGGYWGTRESTPDTLGGGSVASTVPYEYCLPYKSSRLLMRGCAAYPERRRPWGNHMAGTLFSIEHAKRAMKGVSPAAAKVRIPSDAASIHRIQPRRPKTTGSETFDCEGGGGSFAQRERGTTPLWGPTRRGSRRPTSLGARHFTGNGEFENCLSNMGSTPRFVQRSSTVCNGNAVSTKVKQGLGEKGWGRTSLVRSMQAFHRNDIVLSDLALVPKNWLGDKGRRRCMTSGSPSGSPGLRKVLPPPVTPSPRSVTPTLPSTGGGIIGENLLAAFEKNIYIRDNR